MLVGTEHCNYRDQAGTRRSSFYSQARVVLHFMIIIYLTDSSIQQTELAINWNDFTSASLAPNGVLKTCQSLLRGYSTNDRVKDCIVNRST